MGAVRVRVSKFVDVLGEIAKEEYVVLSNLAGDFDLAEAQERQLSFSTSYGILRFGWSHRRMGEGKGGDHLH